jgi:hypothetical protein
MGFNRHFPKVLITAPKYFGGMNPMDLSDQQGYSHLDIIIRHVDQQSIISTFFIQMTESFHIKTGLLGSCWETLTSPKYVDAPWIQSTIRFMQTINLTMTVPRIHTIRKIREHDTSLMEVLSNTTLTSKEICIFNNTRLFLQVSTVAEISNNSGNSIHPSYTTPNPPNRRPVFNGVSMLLWPKQPAPNRRMLRVWIKGIKL